MGRKKCKVSVEVITALHDVASIEKILNNWSELDEYVDYDKVRTILVGYAYVPCRKVLKHILPDSYDAVLMNTEKTKTWLGFYSLNVGPVFAVHSFLLGPDKELTGDYLLGNLDSLDLLEKIMRDENAAGDIQRDIIEAMYEKNLFMLHHPCDGRGYA